jgi:hypothetical protein
MAARRGIRNRDTQEVSPLKRVDVNDRPGPENEEKIAEKQPPGNLDDCFRRDG